MHSTNTRTVPFTAPNAITAIKNEIEALTSQRSELMAKHKRNATWLQGLGKNYGWGIAGKLEWVNFKLRFKQEQLAESEGQDRETMRQKMERMIIENPSELEPHIRRAYQTYIAAEPVE